MRVKMNSRNKKINIKISNFQRKRQKKIMILHLRILPQCLLPRILKIINKIMFKINKKYQNLEKNSSKNLNKMMYKMKI